LVFEYTTHDLPQEEFLPLQKKSFLNREARTNLFVTKLKTNQPIDLVSGEQVVIDMVMINEDQYTLENFEDLKERLPILTSGDDIKFHGENRDYDITALAKTVELGGKGKGGNLGPERRVISILQKQFEKIEGPITLKIGDKTYLGITGVLNVKENQKADFVFTGEEPVYVSYKPGNSVKDIIGYGGITKIAEGDKTVANFINAVREKTPSFKDGKIEYSATLDFDINRDLILKAMYGNQAGNSPGENNVQVILQGNDVSLVKESNGVYNLTHSHVIFQPEIPEGAYAPVLNARYASDRNQFEIEYCRIGVVPVGARSNAKILFT
jgi:hypothetical protein